MTNGNSNDAPDAGPDSEGGPEPEAEETKQKRRWFAPRQNLQFEIKAVEAEFTWLQSAERGQGPNKVPQEAKEALERCSELLREAKCAFRGWFPRELVVWQHLSQIRQDFLFAVPFNQLPARWQTIRRRLKTLDNKESDSGYWGSEEFEKWVSDRLKQPVEQGGYDAELRSKLREARKFLDDGVMAQLWRTIALRRITVAASIGAILTSIALIYLLKCTPHCPCPPPPDVKSSLITMFVAGALGAQMSILLLRRTGKPDALLSNLAFVRPIIGGVAGLFLALVLHSNWVSIDATQWGYHAVAVAFGFSERAIYRTLSSLARVEDWR